MLGVHRIGRDIAARAAEGEKEDDVNDCRDPEQEEERQNVDHRRI